MPGMSGPAPAASLSPPPGRAPAVGRVPVVFGGVRRPDPSRLPSGSVGASARLPAAVDLQTGRLLRRLRDDRLHLHLGFATMRDYVAERLGFGLRTAQESVRVVEALERLPRTESAALAGEITTGHVRILSRVATERDEERWLARARRMDVRSLARAAAAARERMTSCERGSGSVLAHDGADSLAGEEPDLVPLSVQAPVWILSWWRETTAFVRRLAGGALPQGACLEAVLAESADVAGGAGERWHTAGGGSPQSEGGECLRSAGTGRSSSCLGEVSGPPGDDSTEKASFIHKELAPCGGPKGASSAAAESHGKDAATARGSGLAAEDPARVARRVDARLRELVGERQRSEAVISDRLACLRASGGYLLDGFSSLKCYARERLGLSPRMVDYLLSLHRTLERLPDLRRAYLAGRLTLRQALVVGRAATRATTSAWVRRAEGITLRRLEDEVEYWELLRQERPEVWERLRGGPLPEGIVLVPGRGPRLREPGPGAGPDVAMFGSSRVEHGVAHGSALAPCGSIDGGNCAPDAADAGTHGSAGAPPGWLTGGESDLDVEDAGAHGSARGPGLDARVFIRLLEASEKAVPLPERRGCLRMRVEPGIRRQYTETIASLRSMSGQPLEEWEAFALVLKRFWDVWDNLQTRAQRRRHPAVERDGGRCIVPGCRSVGSGQVQEHHIHFRSAGGAVKDLSNLGSFCNTHHQPLLHGGVIRCRGSAPDGLAWEFGVSHGMRPFLTFYGDVRTGGTAM